MSVPAPLNRVASIRTLAAHGGDVAVANALLHVSEVLRLLLKRVESQERRLKVMARRVSELEGKEKVGTSWEGA